MNVQGLKRVVVTGLGLVTPLGLGVENNFQKIMSGASGIRKLKGKGYDKLPCQVAGLIPEDDMQS